MPRFLCMQLAVWVSACGGGGETLAPPASPAPEAPMGGPDVAELVRRADEALAATLKPDYDRPMVQKPDGLAWVSELYLEACRAGDRRSCWLADSINSTEATAAMVRDHCLAGDLMSCRAVRSPAGAEPDRRLRGWVGRALSCDGADCEETVRTRCERLDCREPMQQECAAGFPVSCWNRDLNTEDQQAYAQAVALAREGCRAGILAECHWLWRDGLGGSDLKLAAHQLCTQAAVKCGVSVFVQDDDRTMSRDAEERACQYGKSVEQDAACFSLIHGYHDRWYREPVPGRGRALAERGCRGDADCIQRVRKEWMESGGP